MNTVTFDPERSRRLLDTSIADHRVESLLAEAHRLTISLSQGRGYIWAALGIDSAPCPMGCAFCSHARKWGIYTRNERLSLEQTVALAGEAADQGADFITLRTTQFYEVRELSLLGEAIRQRIGDEIHLVANTGECDVEDLRLLKSSGFSMAYHVVRLREGVDTGHSIDLRLRTIDSILNSGLELQYLVEPLGPEHSMDEILVEARRARSLGASGTGVMARVPVLGTPLARFGQVSPAYLGRVAALTRLEYPDGGRYLCVHPFTPEALSSGCNTVVVEQAANPRDSGSTSGAWRGFGMAEARVALKEAGFSLRPEGEPDKRGSR